MAAKISKTYRSTALLLLVQSTIPFLLAHAVRLQLVVDVIGQLHVRLDRIARLEFGWKFQHVRRISTAANDLVMLCHETAVVRANDAGWPNLGWLAS